MRQEAVEDVGQLAVDTHGFTYFAMVMAKLPGFDLCPRLANLKSQRLYLPVGFDVPDALKDVVDCDLDGIAMEAAYYEHVRIAS